MTDEKGFERPKTTKVGYRNPPEKSRFKTGQSGNPHGRPKGAFNVATILERTLREPVVIVENGKRKTVTELEAAIKQVVDQAASGKLKALQLLTTLARSAEESVASNSSAGGTKINVVNMNIDKATGLRLAETFLARHGVRRESANPEWDPVRGSNRPIIPLSSCGRSSLAAHHLSYCGKGWRLRSAVRSRGPSSPPIPNRRDHFNSLRT